MNNSEKTTKTDKTSENEQNVEQVRGPELREKMEESLKKGEDYRAQHSGRDTMKTPNTSNTTKTHKSNT